MADYIIEITAKEDFLVVKDPLTNNKAMISWESLSNVEPGLKYSNECISVLKKSVAAAKERDVRISPEAEALITKATEAARLLY